jgi:hypothetical protein
MHPKDETDETKQNSVVNDHEYVQWQAVVSAIFEEEEDEEVVFGGKGGREEEEVV